MWTRVRNLALSISLAGSALLACKSSEEPLSDEVDASAAVLDAGTSVDSEAPLRTLSWLPNRVFTGADGAHAFRAPLAVYDAREDLSVSVGDPAIAEIAEATLANPQGDTGRYFMVTAKSAGQTTVTASSRGRTATATITVAAYESSRYAAGEARYTAGAGSDPPCTNCHGGANGVDHSPATLSGIDDQGVATIITTGIVNGTPIVTTANHAWTLSDVERDGLVTYLRALPPKGF